ncbi:hypothetical protein [Halostagnicola sp. A56]|uniref:hypothetical protein n=1 Tax=Halostagnicola sp. A56 TaxID=1495067 RepID=UPI0018CF899B|nr:hypothetical protein [Halostagnicola sp. A56]
MSVIPRETPIHVLHVDDDPMFSDLVAKYLEKLSEKITVHTETDPQNGIEQLDNEPIDCQ